ncbi:2922_t:CDS:2, partial [Acaulospora morrowiae]
MGTLDQVELNLNVKIAVIGGSGLYNFDHLKYIGEIYPETPWGYPSSKIIIVEDPR